ncbi:MULTISPECIES: alpha/beta hydrolase [unclassified Streptomyces]|uniref:alpha/beta fold hydrolase n=1 Tax=unclassified Streptomyces TaxID=2593676 RepID=UPI00109E4584|nr:alpha/beta hydrolase [Streptomyces sp. A1136]THA51660.1 alpha/beta hydrolase [Streptomyces sp. A1136]
MIDTKRPPQNIRREIIGLPVDGTDLALHLWRPRGDVKGAVFYFHGLQSHAGWLWEVGPQFADNDIAFFVLDRRGSGISGGPRHELPDAQTVLGDYTVALEHVRTLIGDEVPLSLFGHCLGGSFMAALMHHPGFITRYDAAVFCSSWLGKLHATHSEEERQRLAADTSTELWDAGLRSADFTDEARHRHFIDNDDLAVRLLTRRSRATLLQLERMYTVPQRTLPSVPAAFVSGISDPIVDLDDAQRTFLRMTASDGALIQFATDKHYLFYTDVRARLVDWASAFTLLQGLDRNA